MAKQIEPAQCSSDLFNNETKLQLLSLKKTHQATPDIHLLMCFSSDVTTPCFLRVLQELQPEAHSLLLMLIGS